jgi:hypothetical protein
VIIIPNGKGHGDLLSHTLIICVIMHLYVFFPSLFKHPLSPSLPLCPNFNFSPPPKNIFDYSILALAKKQVLNKMTAASILEVEREGGREIKSFIYLLMLLGLRLETS